MKKFQHKYKREYKTKALREIFEIIMQNYREAAVEMVKSYDIKEFITHNQKVDNLCRELGICSTSYENHKNWKSNFRSKKNNLRLKYLQLEISMQKMKKHTKVKFNQISRGLSLFFINLKFSKMRSTHQYSKHSNKEG